MNVCKVMYLKYKTTNSLEDDRGGIVMVGLRKVEFSAESFLKAHGRQVLELELEKAQQINSCYIILHNPL